MVPDSLTVTANDATPSARLLDAAPVKAHRLLSPLYLCSLLTAPRPSCRDHLGSQALSGKQLLPLLLTFFQSWPPIPTPKLSQEHGLGWGTTNISDLGWPLCGLKHTSGGPDLAGGPCPGVLGLGLLIVRTLWWLPPCVLPPPTSSPWEGESLTPCSRCSGPVKLAPCRQVTRWGLILSV